LSRYVNRLQATLSPAAEEFFYILFQVFLKLTKKTQFCSPRSVFVLLQIPPFQLPARRIDIKTHFPA